MEGVCCMASGVFKHSYKTKTRESLPIAIYNSGAQQCGPSHTWGPGVRDHYLVHHVISGCGYYTENGVTHRITAGDTFLIYPSVVVTYRADENDPWEYCWAGFNGAEAKILMSQTSFRKDDPVVRFQNPDEICDAIVRIYQSSGTTPASELKAIGNLYLLLGLLMEQGPVSAAAGDLSLEYVESAIRFIAHNYSGEIDVGDVAASVGISRSHLYRVFMRHIGTSPNEYLTQFRISQACELLEHTSLPISAVAASVGYDDAFYFSRVFKKVTGQPPSAFLKSTEQPHPPERST